MIINEKDNVSISLEDGHKYALCDIEIGEEIIKYGYPIGTATLQIKTGHKVHTHNLKSEIKIENKYFYKPAKILNINKSRKTFRGYLRGNGNVGIRNEIWIINTVGCTNKMSELIAEQANKIHKGKTDGIFAVTHPYGCSQLGDDHENTRRILANFTQHPNAAGALILGLGCENNCIKQFRNMLVDYDDKRVRFLTVQECKDEINEALKRISEIICRIECDKRVPISLEKLVIGLKCGGSDSLSGITANPLAGRISDRLIEHSGTVVLTETPEMFGAESILMSRCINREVYNKNVNMINNFKKYFINHGQKVYENPSPGNKEGGITTLEEKSLGCIQKGGKSAVTDVIAYGERVRKNGLVLLDGPGNDIVSTTALTAAGCQLILFTTGRGTPLGAFAPTLKISSNTALAKRKPHWIDYDAGKIIKEKNLSFEQAEEELWSLIMDTIEGKSKTKSEINGYREFSLFKNGVTL